MMKPKKTLLILLLLLLNLLATSLLVAQSEDEDETVKVDIPVLPSKDESQNKSSPDQDKQNTSSNESSDKSYQFKGEFNSWLGLSLNDKQKTEFNYNRLQLELTEVYQNITFYVKANARYNTIYNDPGTYDQYRRAENLRFDLTEGYINYELLPGTFLKQWNLFCGQQVVNWGKADEIRPTDIISPQDMTLMVLEDRIKRKLGRFALKSYMNFGEAFRFEALWLPIHRATEGTMAPDNIFTPYFLREWVSSGKTLDLASFSMPERKLSNTDIALKAYLQLFNIDFSFSFYNGYNPMPNFQYSAPTVIKPFLSRVTFWGFDFESTVGAGVVLRGEAAYFTKGKFFNYSNSNTTLTAKYGNSGIIERDYIDATIGFDINNFLTSNLYLNLQYSVNYVFDYEQGFLTSSMTDMQETNHTGIWAVSYEFFNLKCKIEFAGNYNFSQKDYLLKPSFHIKIGPETKIIAGAYFFGGSRTTVLGGYQDKDFGYLKLEHLF